MPHSESEDLSTMPDHDLGGGCSGIGVCGGSASGNGNGGTGIKSPIIRNPAFSHSCCPPEVHKSCFCVRFIAEHTKMLEDSTKVKLKKKYILKILIT